MADLSRRTVLGMLGLGLSGCAARDVRFAPPNTPPEIEEAWRHLNAIRREVGLPAVALDQELSRGAALHARYLELNKVAPFVSEGTPHLQQFRHSPHRQQKGKPGYTSDGAEAGLHSNLAYSGSHRDSIDGHLSSFYHRLPLLRHALSSVGMASHRYGQGQVIHVLRFENDGDERYPSLYPIPHQKKVPLEFRGGENPEPRPMAWFNEAKSRSISSGFPITMDWGREHQAWAWQDRLVKMDGTPLEAHVNSEQLGWHVRLALLPRQILDPLTRYQVTFEGVVDKVPSRFEWQFETRAA